MSDRGVDKEEGKDKTCILSLGNGITTSRKLALQAFLLVLQADMARL